MIKTSHSKPLPPAPQARHGAAERHVFSENEVKAHLNPQTLATIAAALDPQAIMRGEISAPLDRATLLILEAGKRCGEFAGRSLFEIEIAAGSRPQDYQRMLDRSFIPELAAPDIFILSENETRDTLRPFLREQTDGKGKRSSWSTVRSTKEKLMAWIAWRTNAHNQQNPKDSRRPKDEATKLFTRWKAGKDWNIPKAEIIPPTSADGIANDWRFLSFHKLRLKPSTR